MLDVEEERVFGEESTECRRVPGDEGVRARRGRARPASAQTTGKASSWGPSIQPPSTQWIAPVTKDDSSEAR